MKWRTWSVALLLGFVAQGGARAGELQQCIGRSGQVSWTDGGCPGGTRAGAVVAFQANDREEAQWRRQRMADLHAWQERARSEAAARQRGSRSMRRQARTAGWAAADVCGAAKRRRDKVRDRDFMRMTYERIQELDDSVREACRS